jgi:hypothetical protein
MHRRYIITAAVMFLLGALALGAMCLFWNVAWLDGAPARIPRGQMPRGKLSSSFWDLEQKQANLISALIATNCVWKFLVMPPLVGVFLLFTHDSVDRWQRSQRTRN